MVKKSSVLRFFQILGVPNLDTVSKIRPTTNQILIISELLINEHKVPQDGLRSIFSKSIKKGVFNLVKFTLGQTLRYIVTSYYYYSTLKCVCTVGIRITDLPGIQTVKNSLNVEWCAIQITIEIPINFCPVIKTPF